jgi:Flp pilus assembly protein TadG
MLLVVAGGRLATARNDIDSAARAGARAASIARSPDAALTDARKAVESALSDSHLDCSSLVVTVDTKAFRPGGQTTANLDCQVDLSMVTMLGLPLSKTLHAQFTEWIDPYRGTTS